VRWYIPVIPALRRLKQKDLKFKASLGYIVRPVSKKRKRKKERRLGWGERNEENLYIKRDIKDTFNKVQCMNLIWILIILA
jgi:hypothetical protein